MDFIVTLELRTPERTGNATTTAKQTVVVMPRDSDQWTPRDVEVLAAAIAAEMTNDKDPGPIKWRVSKVGPPNDPDNPRPVDWETYSIEVEGKKFSARPVFQLRTNQLPEKFEEWKDANK